MQAKTGLLSAEELKGLLPPEVRLSQGPVAVIECRQKIPCDPCYHSCNRGAIKPFEDINDCPEIDWEKCNGCGTCISKCPGLAIFVIDLTYSQEQAVVRLPYEFLPLPRVNQEVLLLNREGVPVGKGPVVKVQNTKAQDRTPVIWVAVPKALAMEVRNIRTEG
ncbi:MAG: 4Fe-4S binding protein [Bacillota bacterium]